MNHTYKIKSHFWTHVCSHNNALWCILVPFLLFMVLSNSHCVSVLTFPCYFSLFSPSNQDSCVLFPLCSWESVTNPPRAWLGNSFGSGQAASQTLLAVLATSLVQKGLWDEQFGWGGWCSAYSHPGRWISSLLLKKIPVCPFGSCCIGCPAYLDCKAPAYLRSLVSAVH